MSLPPLLFLHFRHAVYFIHIAKMTPRSINDNSVSILACRCAFPFPATPAIDSFVANFARPYSISPHRLHERFTGNTFIFTFSALTRNRLMALGACAGTIHTAQINADFWTLLIMIDELPMIFAAASIGSDFGHTARIAFAPRNPMISFFAPK